MRWKLALILAALVILEAKYSKSEIEGYRLIKNSRVVLAYKLRKKVVNPQACANLCNKQAEFACGLFAFRTKGSRCFLYDEITRAKAEGRKWFKTAIGFDVYEAVSLTNCISKAHSTGVNYRGTQSLTRGGLPCQRWDSSFPHKPRYRPVNPSLHKNYCRNPDFDKRGPWCYTADPSVRYQFCDIPVCSGTGPKNATTTTTTTTKSITTAAEATTTLAPNNGPLPVVTDNCITCIGKDYRGTKRVTKSGKTCQRWDKTFPHNHTYSPRRYPEENLVDNHCRNPDGDLEPWCYTTDKSVRWEYCGIPRCTDNSGYPVIPEVVNRTTTCFRGRGESYRGTAATTVSGRTCMSWIRQNPHKHTRTPGNYPCSDLRNDYCRNPGGSYEQGLWCYTTDPNKRWEKCDVPDCDASSTPASARFYKPGSCGKQVFPVNFDDQDFELRNEDLVPVLPRRRKRSMQFNRIMGGDEAAEGSWPWMASLRFEGGHFCGGTIITSTWVLTAAHCLDDNSLPENLSVWAGYHFGYGPDTQIRPVKRYRVHAGYSKQPVGNDLCMVELTTPFTFNSRVMPICLPQRDYAVPVGTYCVAAGWGRTLERKATGLKQLVMPVLSRKECIRNLGLVLRSEKQMCAGWKGLGKDVCRGDSGGPLMCKVGGSWTIQGVTSWGSSCSMGGDVGAYVTVSAYIDWIEKLTGTTS